MVFAKFRTHISNEILYTCYEVRVYVGLYASDCVIVQDQSSSTSFLEYIQYLFTVTETIEESCQSSHIHAEAREEQQVGIDTLKFIHNRTNILHTV